MDYIRKPGNKLGTKDLPGRFLAEEKVGVADAQANLVSLLADEAIT